MKYHRIFVGAMIALATTGFFVAFFLTAEHYLGEVPPCSFLSGCEEVTTSKYAQVLGVPISLFGAGYFLAVAALLLAYFQGYGKKLFQAAGALVSAGAVIAGGLIYLQVGVLGAICIYCVTSDTISLLLFALFILARKK